MTRPLIKGSISNYDSVGQYGLWEICEEEEAEMDDVAVLFRRLLHPIYDRLPKCRYVDLTQWHGVPMARFGHEDQYRATFIWNHGCINTWLYNRSLMNFEHEFDIDINSPNYVECAVKEILGWVKQKENTPSKA